MSAADGQKAFHAAIRDRVFPQAYYFFGDEDYLKEDAIQQLIAAAVDPATKDFNLDVRRGSDLDAESLESLLGTPPMMAERRVAVIRDVPALSKPAREALNRWLERLAPDCLLILSAPAGAKADPALERRAFPVEWATLNAERLPKWITYYVENTLSTTITPDAARLLQEAVGSELAQLRLELDKLASFATGKLPIDAKAVSEVVGIRPGETVSDLLDAIAQRLCVDGQLAGRETGQLVELQP